MHDEEFVLPFAPWMEISRRVQFYETRANASSVGHLRS
jgi:hypothetical protein